ncbi:hypothetical protein CTAYLR_006610 [Chrysophaeum taylorii]|uniref:Uncharacterized protein n=1 Tax=Chrysophaeum taylorii TaxID=2483200 RepID=A0AAD7XT68_9STRA|nr:hypothetical protein CTAYLR_006610 [Chrysophaeum taylorii]
MSQTKKIYEALDARNYKAALKLCSKGNAAKTPLIGALKALTLQRLGRAEESSAECTQLLQAHPGLTDQNALSPLAMTLSLLGRDDDVMRCWEDAFAAAPKDEELGREVFKCCVRRRDFAKQRAVAMRLYKVKKRPDYLCWFAASALLEARCGPPRGATATLQLAERMAVKAIEERRGSVGRASSEELQLLVAIRREAGELEACLDALQKVAFEYEEARKREGARLMQPSEVVMLAADALEAKGDSDDARRKYEAAVVSKPNDWAAIAAYARTAHRCDRIEAARELFDRLRLERPKDRGPALGRLEISRLCGLTDELREATLEYAETWAESRSCFDDVEIYIRALREQGDDAIAPALADLARRTSRVAIRDAVVVVVDGEDSVVAASEATREEEDEEEEKRRLRRHATFVKCARFANDALPIDVLGFEIEVEFGECLRAVELGEPAREDLLLLCYRMVRDLALQHAGKARLALLVQGVGLLEWAARRRRLLGLEKVEAQATLSSIESWEAIGGHEAALRRYSDLGVKQIQLESLGWLLFPWCLRGGFATETRQHCRNIAALHRSARNDAAEYSIRALEAGTFSRAVELVEFHERKMDRSVQLAIAKAEAASVDLLLALHSLAEATAYFNQLEAKPALADLDTLEMSLNSDLRVLPAWRDSGAADTPTERVEAVFAANLRRYLRTLVAQREAAAALVDRSPDRLAAALAVLEAEVLLDTDEDEDLISDLANVASRGIETRVAPWLAHPWRLRAWTVACGAYRAARAHFLAADDVASLFSEVGESIARVKVYVTAPENRRFLDDDDGIAVSRQWLSGICYVLQHAVAPLVLALQVILPAPSGVRRKRKKAPEGPAAAVVSELLDFLSKLRTVLRDEASAVEDETAVKRRDPAANFLPASPLNLLPPDVDADLRDALRVALTSSQALALGRILEIIGSKHAALSEFAAAAAAA